MLHSSQDPYPMVELATPPRPHPLVEPHLICSPESSSVEKEDGLRVYPIPSFLPNPGHRTGQRIQDDIARAKRESFNLFGSKYLVTNTGKTLKLPVPSKSAADPLNWSFAKRAGAIFALALFSIVCLTASQAAAVTMEGVQESFGHENASKWLMRALLIGPTLFEGFGCFLWVPLSIGVGRRPTILIATIVVLLAMIWASLARSFASLVTAVCFIGLGEGLSLSLVFLMVIDLTYINERPKAIALMWSVAGCFGTSGVALVPIMTNQGHDWRTFYRYGTIAIGVSFIVTFFLYPETYFKRPTVAFDGLIVLQSATEKLTVFQDNEQDSELYRDLPEYPSRTGFAGLRDRLGLARSPFASWASMGRCFIQMGYCIVNPLIFWVFVASAMNSANLMFIGATYANVLIHGPYHISAKIIGTVHVASGTGALVGFVGWCLIFCKVITKLSRRNCGVLEAEHYLIGYIIPVLTGALSSLIYGLAVDQHWHFAWIYISYGLCGLSFVNMMIANTLWVAEAFPRWAAPALAVVGGGCYLLSFALSFAIVPWIDAHGYKWAGIELSVFQILGGLVAMPVAFWGKGARQALNGRWANDRSGALRPL
ncbi:hypothetical protein ACN47E_006895 [Coniothyrium glycines]